MIVDTHCHLEEKYYKIDEITKEMNDNLLIAAGCDINSNLELLNINKNNVYKCFGIHPEFVKSYLESDIEFIENNIDKIVAIGEIGLDYYFSSDTKEEQKKLFIKQLNLAQKYNKPVIIHSRDSIEDTYEILKNYKLKMDIHCFSSSYEMAEKFIKLGAKIGIGGVVTFKNGKKLQEIVEKLPLEDFLLETDSPYLTPEPYRGQQNRPINVFLVAKKISEIKNIKEEDVISITTNNALEFFNIKRK